MTLGRPGTKGHASPLIVYKGRLGVRSLWNGNRDFVPAIVVLSMLDGVPMHIRVVAIGFKHITTRVLSSIQISLPYPDIPWTSPTPKARHEAEPHVRLRPQNTLHPFHVIISPLDNFTAIEEPQPASLLLNSCSLPRVLFAMIEHFS